MIYIISTAIVGLLVTTLGSMGAGLSILGGIIAILQGRGCANGSAENCI